MFKCYFMQESVSVRKQKITHWSRKLCGDPDDCRGDFGDGSSSKQAVPFVFSEVAKARFFFLLYFPVWLHDISSMNLLVLKYAYITLKLFNKLLSHP